MAQKNSRHTWKDLQQEDGNKQSETVFAAIQASDGAMQALRNIVERPEVGKNQLSGSIGSHLCQHVHKELPRGDLLTWCAIDCLRASTKGPSMSKRAQDVRIYSTLAFVANLEFEVWRYHASTSSTYDRTAPDLTSHCLECLLKSRATLTPPFLVSGVRILRGIYQKLGLLVDPLTALSEWSSFGGTNGLSEGGSTVPKVSSALKGYG